MPDKTAIQRLARFSETRYKHVKRTCIYKPSVMQQLFKLNSRKYNKDLVIFGDIALALEQQNAPQSYIDLVIKKESGRPNSHTHMQLLKHQAGALICSAERRKAVQRTYNQKPEVKERRAKQARERRANKKLGIVKPAKFKREKETYDIMKERDLRKVFDYLVNGTTTRKTVKKY